MKGNRKGKIGGRTLVKKKYELITDIYAEAIRDVTSIPENWIGFLRSACRNYHLPFDEQLLVHVQRPDATAVLEMEDWNRKFGRWVKRDSKGIAVIDKKSDNTMRLKYYFDVSDTKEGRYRRLVRPVPLWEVQEQHKREVQETLANAFGVEGTKSFVETIQEAANNIATDNITDYLTDIQNNRENSLIEEISEYNIEVQTKQILSNSVAFMIMQRCGIEAEIYLGADDFRGITDFNTPRLTNLIGVAVSDMSEMALMQIADTVKKVQLEDKKVNRTFADKETKPYNEDINITTERGFEYEKDRIQPTGGLSSSEHNRSERAENTFWEIRITTQEVPARTEIRNISNLVDGREANSTSDGNAGDSTKQNGGNYVKAGQRAEHNRETEGRKSDDVGGNDEQYPADGGGSSDAGANLHLEWYDRSKEDKSLPFLNEEDVKSLLLLTPHLKAGIEDIKVYFETHTDKEERTKYIKEIFNNEYTEMILENGKSVGYKTYENVLHLWQGSYSSKTAQIYYDWGVIAEYYEGMRLTGELKDKTKPLPTIQGQLTFMKDLAEEKTSAFSFSQEIIDYVLSKGNLIQNGKYRIYSYFLQGHTTKEREEFLKNEYGIGGYGPVLSGTEISENHDAKGIKLQKGYGENAPSILLKWNKVVKRIDELITAGHYMSQKELDYLPEYEKKVLAAKIFQFYSNQPEEVVRPYPIGVEFYNATKIIRPQLEEPERVEEILKGMEEVLARTAYYARNYQVMQTAYNDLKDFRDGKYSLFTPLSDKTTEQISYVPETTSEKRSEEISEENSNSVSNEIKEISAMKPQYDLQINTLVYIGIKEYEIEFLSDERAVLRDMEFPIFTEEMSREELESRISENPANDRLKINQQLSELPPEKINTQITPAPVQEKPEKEQTITLSQSNISVDTKEQKEEESQVVLVPGWEQKKKKVKTREFDLHPEIPLEMRNEYHITNDELGYGTAKEKFRANIAAIQILKNCESENRYATPEEQEILSGYVGWGGLSDVFDETKSAWSSEYLELKTVLTEDEYAAARQSTLTAFYTPVVVIRAMYQVLMNMGLKSGNILEPSCAIGNFIGMKPENLSECKVYGVEIDSISGRIAQQLYQKSNITVQGYEEAELPDSFFDVALGNVPFGQFKLLDKRYDKYNFFVHDYFFAKTLDKIRPGGVIAFITSSGTMDKKNPAIRKYISQRAELLGAIRLPNNTFQKNAGTEVTADILFLQKRDRLIETEEEWLYLDTDENGITQNHYFVKHPEMILGEMSMESGPFGMTSTCKPYEDKELSILLSEAIENIQAEITDYETEELVEEQDKSIPANPLVPNYSYTIYNGKIYYRENSRMNPVELSVTGANRVRGMINIRDCVRELISYQTEGYADSVIVEQQKKLNNLYDIFRSKYGLLNARANSLVFSDDNSYPLLCSLEILSSDGKLERKADMFSKRTIKPHEVITKVETASEALSISIAEKAQVDMDYMCSLTGKSAEEIENELTGVIFRLPDEKGKQPQFVSEDEYLSGNVRQKLKEARLAADTSEVYQSNVEALEKVQPKNLGPSDINVRLGATWIPPKDIEDFMFELLETPNYRRWNIKVQFSKYTGEWRIDGKSMDRGNVKANNTYGTHRANAYKIIEDTLNLRDIRIYDYVETDEGKKKAILNKKETSIAQGKQDLIKQAFQDWIWKEPERRQRLVEFYNENFNAMRPREYDGSHLKFYGMNPEIQLRQHQKNGVARIIYGGNSLLAYVVGAGKTYTMVAAAMESKRLGLCNKSMVVVPNHIIEQFAAEWLQLYPAANILVATKKDFETKNRKRFCARIATSDIDAVIIGHSQFEKIPLSIERQRQTIKQQIDEIIKGIEEAKSRRGERFTIKQLEKSKKNLLTKLKKLNDQSRKDDVVTFEELGIDRLFVDEADGYKNLYLYTKMRNVGGIAQTEAQKSSDMFMKCRYLDDVICCEL